MNIETTCCFTGHRKLPASKVEKIVIGLDREIERLIAEGVTHYISGGALGFDQIAASLIIAKRQMGKPVHLTLALPCKDQDALWSDKQRELYQHLLDEADCIVFVSEDFTPNCMKERNAYMVNNSKYCICALLGERSGTGQTVRMARKKGLRIIDLTK